MAEDQTGPEDRTNEEDDTATTIDLRSTGAATPPAVGAATPPTVAGAIPPAGGGGAPPGGGPTVSTWNVSNTPPGELRLQLTPYIPEKQQDYVRLTFTVGLLLMFAWVIVWASIESASWPTHWDQTKDMLQIILPALTGLIGSVSGFYFGSRGATASNNKGSPS